MSGLEDEVLGVLGSKSLLMSEIRKVVGVPIGEVLAALSALQGRGRVVQDGNTMRWTALAAAKPPKKPSKAPVKSKTLLPHKLDGAWPWQADTQTELPEPIALPPESVDWLAGLDDEKRAVVLSDASEKLAVEAPPGCGKTYAACARAAHLCESLYGPRILFLSFTRIAVREVRDRIGLFLPGGEEAKVWTIDQLAYRLTGAIDGSYEDTVQRAVAAFDGDGGADDFFHEIKHVIVDEAQDIVGVRAEFVFRALAAVTAHGGGFTVFHDPAQAIYDWSEDEGKAVEVTRLVDLIATGQPGVKKRKLGKNYRVSDPYLAALFKNMREFADRDVRNAAKMRKALADRQSEDINNLGNLLRAVPEDEKVFVLFRSRMEAIEQSWRLDLAGIRHGLRFGGTPHYVPPWIAAVFNTIGEAEVDWAQFSRGWQAVANQRLLEGWTVEQAWLGLRRMLGGKTVDVRRLAELIARPVPPPEFATRPVGDARIVLGTIHGVKGREANHVFLVHPKPSGGDDDARVWFVGLTRARDSMVVVGGIRCFSRTNNGRPWRRGRKGATHVWVGQHGDVERARGLGVRTEESHSQNVLCAYQESTQVLCESIGHPSYQYRIRCDAVEIGALNSQVNADLFGIKKAVKGWKSGITDTIYHMRWYDVVTTSAAELAVPDQELKEPFRTTRLWLMPVVGALSTNYL